jgi:hypothetical protein
MWIDLIKRNQSKSALTKCLPTKPDPLLPFSAVFFSFTAV